MLPIELKTEIASLAHRAGAKRVVLFGSRARNEERPRSDIDLAVFGLPQQMEGMFLDGDMDEIIDALIAADTARRLQEQGEA